jgi:hypothetical protein
MLIPEPPLVAIAGAFATINFLEQTGLICAAVATDPSPVRPHLRMSGLLASGGV